MTDEQIHGAVMQQIHEARDSAIMAGINNPTIDTYVTPEMFKPFQRFLHASSHVACSFLPFGGFSMIVAGTRLRIVEGDGCIALTIIRGMPQ